MEKNVIIALDFPEIETSLQFLDLFGSESLFVKIGMELFLQNGPKVIEAIKARGHKLFLDLKLHDIPNTVYQASKGLAQFDVDILTVHAAGGREMMRAAKQGIVDGGGLNTRVIAVTQLTSTSEEQMKQEQGVELSLKESVLHYASLAHEAGLDGAVSSAQEAGEILDCWGPGFIRVTPGIRFSQDDLGDQKRVVTPDIASKMGVSHIVVGRPITQAVDAVGAYQSFVAAFVKDKMGD
ncbi:orotidine-5'-phosphate decarboxylase [Streptococcus sp. NLN64]|uniref:orotidine-5'-phosphate decarboxylase n=1 Tax=Streptococcus sp. NLN64 TaxID=2822799 RepID=UPI0018CAC030|nr:orotidine-5'-phosphate decarboxylase [Streptococcus sp. NLN64]MBG9367260.1 orotidine-5'-phosphate decarboxylase [Streptococcus sp. NLN64]